MIDVFFGVENCIENLMPLKPNSLCVARMLNLCFSSSIATNAILSKLSDRRHASIGEASFPGGGLTIVKLLTSFSLSYRLFRSD